MSLKERIQLEKKEFQILKNKYSFKNIQRIKEVSDNGEIKEKETINQVTHPLPHDNSQK